jgi:hypothetical protein
MRIQHQRTLHTAQQTPPRINSPANLGTDFTVPFLLVLTVGGNCTTITALRASSSLLLSRLNSTPDSRLCRSLSSSSGAALASRARPSSLCARRCLLGRTVYFEKSRNRCHVRVKPLDLITQIAHQSKQYCQYPSELNSFQHRFTQPTHTLTTDDNRINKTYHPSKSNTVSVICSSSMPHNKLIAATRNMLTRDLRANTVL